MHDLVDAARGRGAEPLPRRVRGPPVPQQHGARRRFSWTDSAGGRARLDWVLSDMPDAVIVELGANDALRGIDPAEAAGNLNAILEKLKTACARVHQW